MKSWRNVSLVKVVVWEFRIKKWKVKVVILVCVYIYIIILSYYILLYTHMFNNLGDRLDETGKISRFKGTKGDDSKIVR